MIDKNHQISFSQNNVFLGATESKHNWLKVFCEQYTYSLTSKNAPSPVSKPTITSDSCLEAIKYISLNPETIIIESIEDHIVEPDDDGVSQPFTEPAGIPILSTSRQDDLSGTIMMRSLMPSLSLASVLVGLLGVFFN